MKNLKTVIAILGLILTFNLTAQIAPTSGKKILEVIEDHEGEYLQTVTQNGFSDVVIKAMTDRLPKKLLKYGFT
ncbi:MAG: hypothetical protein JKY16_02755, partial [Lutibacter sp.]|nr:hypothetical protein [Lutibacter sp.]